MSRTSPRVLLIVPGGGFQLESYCLLRQLHDVDVELVLPSENVETEWMQPFLIHRIPGLATRADPGGWSVVARLLSNFRQGFSLLRRRKPAFIVCVGSSICLPLFFMAKLTRTRSVFVESMARVDSISKTGRLIERWRLASPIYVQWPELVDGRSTRLYKGTVL